MLPPMLFEVWGVVLATSAVILRHRLMYNVFCKRIINPGYFGGRDGIILHLGMLPLTTVFFVLTRLPATYEPWINAMYQVVTYLPLLLQGGYYLLHTLGKGMHNYFVNYSSNMRLYIIYIMTFIASSVYMSPHFLRKQEVSDAFLIPTFLGWAILFETFTLVILKIVLHKFSRTRQIFDGVNFSDDMAMNILADVDELEQIVASPRACGALRSLATAHFCEENVDFLMAIQQLRELATTESYGVDATANVRAKANALVDNFVSTCAPHTVNLSWQARQTILNHVAHLNDIIRDSIVTGDSTDLKDEVDIVELSTHAAPTPASEFARDLVEACRDGKEEVQNMLRMQLLHEFRETPEYLAWQAEHPSKYKAHRMNEMQPSGPDADDRSPLLPRDVVLLLHQGGLLDTDVLEVIADDEDPGKNAQTLDCKTSAALAAEMVIDSQHAMHASTAGVMDIPTQAI